MITAFRRALDTWYVKAFFVLMVGSFIFWGVGDVVRMIGTSTWVVKVSGQTIEAQAFQAEFQRAMSAATQALPPGQEATADLKRKVGERALDRTVGEAAMAEVLRDMRLVSPDSTVATAVRAMPVFKDATGQFSKPTFDALLRSNGLTEQRFLQSVRTDLTQKQLLGAIAAGVLAPQTQAMPVYAAIFEKRAADMVEFLFERAPTVPPADEATLRRFYDNRPDIYATPEYRRIKAVVLSPKSLSKEIAISDDDLHAAYERAKASYILPEKRSAQVISVGDEAKANALLASWQAAPDWAAAQDAAKVADANAVALDDATPEQFPDPDLSKAVFAAPPDTVTGPIKGVFGWFLVKVVKVVPGSEKTFDSVKNELKDRVLAENATDIIYTRANTLDNLLGNGGALDDLPGDLGLIPLSGSLDADGKTLEGERAPLPDPAELRTAMIEAAFKLRPGDPPRLTEAKTPGGPAYFAMTVEEIIPPAVKPFDTIKDRVAADWTFEQQRHEQETAAAAMLAAIQAGRNFPDAATIAGVIPHLTPLVTRGEGAAGMPPELQRVLFGLKKDEPAMVETSQGFVVAVPAEIAVADPHADKAGFDKLRSELSQNIASDYAGVFQEAVRLRANPNINRTNFDRIVQPQQ
jgi:peptidyl-prolyl cis-trans isomerase D